MNKIKNLFSTPKKAIITSVCLLAVVALLGTGTAFALPAIAERNSLGKTTVQNYALADAGIDSANALNLHTDFERENGKYVYEVEFTADGIEYDYILDAKTGAVIGKETDDKRNNTVNTDTDSQTTNPAAKSITLDTAKGKALADAGVAASSVTYTKAELDDDDGIQVYDIEFYTATTEYEYEINASTGAVVDKSAEARQTGKKQSGTDVTQEPAQSTYIGVDKAKSIAVSHAGLKISDVSFLKAKLDDDDGRVEYEVDFYYNGMEYDYSIDAVKGTVIEYESEYDD